MTAKAPPVIRPHRCKDYSCRQSRYEHVPSLPTRMILLAPSGSGKTILLQNLLLDVYRGAFQRIYLFSPSVHLDHAWDPVKKYVEKTLGVDPEREPYAFDHYAAGALAAIVQRQRKVAELQKRQEGSKEIYGVAIVVDDFADDARRMRQDRVLDSLFTRGRHAMISTFVSVQKYTAVNPVQRVNASANVVFRLRNNQDLQTWLDENSAVYDKQTLQRIYEHATRDPYSFLYVNMLARERRDLFFLRFEARLVPTDADDDAGPHNPNDGGGGESHAPPRPARRMVPPPQGPTGAL